MDFLINNPLASMSGPYFLVFYTSFIVAMIVIVAIMKTVVDSTGKLPIPQISNEVDPYEISYLRGEERELARSVIFSLIKKGFLEFSETKISVKKSKYTGNIESISKIEQITLDWFGTERTTREVFEPTGLIEQLASYGRVYKEKLERQNMLVNDDIKAKLTFVRWFAIVAVIGLGFYKASAAIAKGHSNIIILVILAVIGFAVIYFMSFSPRISKLGKTYLRRLQLAFDTLKNNTLDFYTNPDKPQMPPQNTLTGIDPMLLSVGVFGGGILAGTAFDSYNQAFKKSDAKQNYNDGCGAGCGCGDCSSTSSLSSCNSTSSCSSGSSCSSCGGCGGCS